MDQDTDALTQQIATTRQELDRNLSRLQARARSAGWRFMWRVVVPTFALGLVLSARGRRCVSEL